jgi:hypothetical protein
MITGKIDIDTWNEEIFPKFETGEIKERKDLIKDGFLMVYQIFNSVIQEGEELYNVSGWRLPGKEGGYVVIEKK